MSGDVAILGLMSDAFGGRGGIAQYNRDFASVLAGSDFVSSIVIIPRHSPDEAAPPFGVQQRPAHAGRFSYVLATLCEVLSCRVDVVFCGHLFMAPLAMLIARLKQAKLVIQMHGVEAWQRPTRLRHWAVEAADLVLCVSRHTRAKVLGWTAIAPERVLVVPNTVAEIFKPGDGSALRSTWALQGKRVLLTVGRLSAAERYKGHDRVILALPQLLARAHNVTYAIIGDGDDRERLERLAAQTGVADRVRFLGSVDAETLAEAYRMADLFVMPSTGEGFGIVFLEAMASGTPALGLAVAGAVDALAEGELGWVTTEAGFVAALQDAIGQPKPESGMLAAAVSKRFGMEQFRTSVAAALCRLTELA